MQSSSVRRSFRTLSLAAILVLLGAMIAPFAVAAYPIDQVTTDSAEFAPGEAIVKFDARLAPVDPAAVLSSLTISSQFGEERPATFAAEALDESRTTYRLSFSPQLDVLSLVSLLEKQEGVIYAEPNYLLKASLMPNDKYAGQQWAITQIQADKAWDITTGSEGVTVALLDTGVDKDHPDLAGKVVEGYNFIADNADASDDEGHGTYTAGLAAANTNNEVGIAGVSWAARIMPVKILDADGGGPVSNFAKGLRFAADHGARVISVSAGVPFDSETMAEAVKYAHDKGAVIVAAAGNTPDGRPNYPAGYPEVIAVGSTGAGDSVSGFSSFGDYLDVSAPGAGILSTAWDDGKHAYMWGNGTSASCPLVAGVAALVLSVRPDLTNDQVKQVIEGSSDDLGPAGWDEHYGFGRVNAFLAVQAARDGNVNIGHQSAIKGRVLGVDPASAAIHLNTGETANPDAGGNYQFTNLGPGSYTISAEAPGHRSPYPKTVNVNGKPEDVQIVDLQFEPGIAAAFAPAAWVPDSGSRRYFSETSHTLSNGFKSYWERNGGLAIFGFPISEEFVENGYVVQYFERNRFEYHPEYSGTRYEVLLGLLGSELNRDRGFVDANPSALPQAAWYFPETGNSLSGEFLAYWQQHGGLAVFGYPISESFEENGFRVQYFERNRFEYHPELPPVYRVSLGLLGNDLAKQRGFIPY